MASTKLQLRFAHSRGGLDGRSSAAFSWVWHFLKDESVCPGSVVDLKDSGDELTPTKCPHSSHPSNLQDRTSARLRMSPFHGGAESQGQIQELSVLMSPQMPHGKTHCPSMQPPAPEQRSAMSKAQSLGSSLIHTIPAPHQRLPGLEDTALLFIRYQPPNSSLPCVEDTLSFTWYQPLISGCRVWKTLLSYSHDTSPPTAVCHV